MVFVVKGLVRLGFERVWGGCCLGCWVWRVVVFGGFLRVRVDFYLGD